MPAVILLTFCFSLLLVALPDTFWEWFYDTLIRKKNKAQALFQLVSDLCVAQEMTTPELPTYKYYTPLLQQVLTQGRKFGSPFREVLKEIRLSLTQDIQFEKVIHKDLMSHQAQFLIVTFITWIFIFMSGNLLQLSFPLKDKLVVALLQLSGWILYRSYFFYGKKTFFRGIGETFSVLYGLKILLKVGVPLSLVLEETKTYNFLKRSFASKEITFLQKRIEEILYKLQKQGIPVQEEWQILLDEVDFLQQQTFKSFSSRQTVLRLVILVLFFFTGYFYYLQRLFANIL